MFEEVGMPALQRISFGPRPQSSAFTATRFTSPDFYSGKIGTEGARGDNYRWWVENTRLAATLATKLRLTPQTRFDGRTAERKRQASLIPIRRRGSSTAGAPGIMLRTAAATRWRRWRRQAARAAFISSYASDLRRRHACHPAQGRRRRSCRHIETNPRGICASRLVVLNPQWSYS